MSIRKSLILPIAICTALAAQIPSPSLTMQDLQAASIQYQTNIDPLLLWSNKGLIDGHANPDGSRGYQITPTFEVGATHYTGDFVKDSIVRLREDVCASRAIVVAEAGDGKGFLIHNDQGIVTARSFLIQSVLYGNVHVGDLATVVEFGGSVTQGNLTLRVGVNGVKPFIKGHSYLLFLDKTSQYHSDAYFLSDYVRDRVVDNKIFSSIRAGDDIIQSSRDIGESVDHFANKITQALAQHSCPSNLN